MQAFVFECSGGDFQSQDAAGVRSCHVFEWDRVFITGGWECSGDALVSMWYILVYYKKTPQFSLLQTRLHCVFPPSAFPVFTAQESITVNIIFFSPSGVNLLPTVTVQKVRRSVLQECLLNATEPISPYLLLGEDCFLLSDHVQTTDCVSDDLEHYNDTYAVCHCLKSHMSTARRTCVRNREAIHALMEHFPFPAHLEVLLSPQ